MRVQLPWGRQTLEIDVADANVIGVRRSPITPPIGDVGAAVHQALEKPFNFPTLGRALTPDDHVAISIDERLPRLLELLIPLLEHVRSAGVSADAITLLCLPPSTGQQWALELPDEFQDVRVEVHQPGERRKLAYLATTRSGRRIYLNRSAVDADQLILLTARRYDPRSGIDGAEIALFPSLCDEATCQEFAGKLAPDGPISGPSSIRVEAAEVAWLLGAPFFVQVIEGTGDEVTHVVAGTVESSREGERLLDERWRVQVDRPADVVVAGIGGNPDRVTFADLAHAFYCGARVVRPGGRVILLTAGKPNLGRAAAIMRQHNDPVAALKALLTEKPADLEAGFLWAGAAQKTKLFLLSQLPNDVVEELFATPLPDGSAVKKLLSDNESCLVLPDAHRTLAVIRSSKGS
jgi:nickel-dependent lactate racemase